MQIKNSELVLREDGSVYHLALKPEDIFDTIITVGDQNRVEQVSRHFDRLIVSKQCREFKTHSGYIGNKGITVISTGIGPDNIDIVLNELDVLRNFNLETREINPTLKQLEIIRLGTSGAVRKEIETGSIVISAGSVGLDGLMHFYDYPESEITDSLLSWDIPWPVKPYFAWSDESLRNRFAHLGYQGITITAGGFYGPQSRSLRIPSREGDLIDLLSERTIDDFHFSNMEMETSAIYGLGKALGHKALSINCILANRKAGTFVSDYKILIDKMIQSALEIITTLE